MEHTRSGEDYHWTGLLDIRSVKAFDVLEIKHVSLDKGFANLLVGPRDEHLVVVVGLLRQPHGKVDRDLKREEREFKIVLHVLHFMLSRMTFYKH